MSTKSKTRQGQVTLILVMVTMVAALGIAVASSSQSKINLKDTIYSTQTNQAITCAEAGIERALAYNDLQDDIELGSKVTLTSNTQEGCDKYDVTIQDYPILDLATSTGELNIPSIKENMVQQLRIAGYNDGEKVVIKFGSTSVDGTGNPNQDSVIALYQYTADVVERRIIFCDSSGIDNTVNNLIAGTDYEFGTLTNGTCTYETMALPGAPDRVLRIRPLYSDIKLDIDNFKGHAGYLINSVADTGTVEREIEVYTFYSQLPAGLDEAIVSFGGFAIIE